MNRTARELSESIDQVARPLAEWVVTRHEERDPSLADRYQQWWRGRWVADVSVRVGQLAQAVAVRRPLLFAETVAWSAAGFEARDVTIDDLLTSLECMAEVFRDELPEAARDAALPCVEAAIARLRSGERAPEMSLPADDRARRLSLEYLERVLDGRRRDAEQHILDAADDGMSIADLYHQVLEPAQVEIGLMWHLNEITVADEHFATATTESVLALLRHRAVPERRKPHAVVAAAVGGELHALGIRMVADFFEMDGWRTIYLGASLPHEDIVSSIRHYEAHLLAASATSVLALRSLGNLVDLVRLQPDLEGLPVIVGGAPFRLVPDLWQELGADGSAGDAEAAVALGNRLVSGKTAEVD